MRCLLGTPPGLACRNETGTCSLNLEPPCTTWEDEYVERMPAVEPYVVSVFTSLPGKQKVQLWPWAEPFLLWPVSGPYWHVETAQGV